MVGSQIVSSTGAQCATRIRALTVGLRLEPMIRIRAQHVARMRA